MSTTNTVFVNILDKDYQVACPPEEKRALDTAAKELDRRMRTIRTTGANIGTERTAIMAALNLCHELQTLRNQIDSAPTDSQALQRLADKLDSALAKF